MGEIVQLDLLGTQLVRKTKWWMGKWKTQKPLKIRIDFCDTATSQSTSISSQQDQSQRIGYSAKA